jgi:hypothetical protein
MLEISTVPDGEMLQLILKVTRVAFGSEVRRVMLAGFVHIRLILLIQESHFSIRHDVAPSSTVNFQVENRM